MAQVANLLIIRPGWTVNYAAVIWHVEAGSGLGCCGSSGIGLSGVNGSGGIGETGSGRSGVGIGLGGGLRFGSVGIVAVGNISFKHNTVTHPFTVCKGNRTVSD